MDKPYRDSVIRGVYSNLETKQTPFGWSFKCINSYNWLFYQIFYRTDIRHDICNIKTIQERRITLTEIEEFKHFMDTSDMNIEDKKERKYYDYSYMFNDYNYPVNYKIVLSSRNLGKGLLLDDILPTPTGLKSVDEIRVNDYLIGSSGERTKVLEVYENENQDIYEITFSDGSKQKCDGEHLWTLVDKRGKHKTFKTSYLFTCGIYKSYKHIPRLSEAIKYSEDSATAQLRDLTHFEQLVVNNSFLFGYINNIINYETCEFSLCETSLRVIIKNNKENQHVIRMLSYYANVNLTITEECVYIFFSRYSEPYELILKYRDYSFECFKNIFYSLPFESRVGFIDGFTKGNIRVLGKNKDYAKIIINNDIKEYEVDERIISVLKSILTSLTYTVYDKVRGKKRVLYCNKKMRFIKNIEYIGKSTTKCFKVDAEDSLFVCNPTHNILTHNTHGLNVELQQRDRTFMLLRRKNNEITKDAMETFGQKYGMAINGSPWLYRGKRFYLTETDPSGKLICGKQIGYVDRLSNADGGSHLNFDYPFVTDIIIDEVFAFSCLEEEWKKLQRWIGTLNRSTGRETNNINVWLLGNPYYGYAPILRNLGFGILPKGKHKFVKTINGVLSSVTYELSDLVSPEGTTNYMPENVIDITDKMISYASHIFTVNVDNNRYEIYKTDSQMYVVLNNIKAKTEALTIEHVRELRNLYFACTDVKKPLIYNCVEAMQINEYLPFIKAN